MLISSNTSELFRKSVLIYPSITSDGNASCLFENGCYWRSTNTKNSSILFSFIQKKFVLTSYSLSVSAGCCSPTEWIIEGFNSIEERYTISYKKTLMCEDRYINNIKDSVCNANAPTHHKVDKIQPSSHIRLTHLGERECCCNNFMIALAKIVFTGYLKEAKDRTSCVVRSNVHSNIIFMLIFLIS